MVSEPIAAIVLPTDAVGGAEKRLAELWATLRKRGGPPHHLVVSEPLFLHLRAIDDLRPSIDRCSKEVIVHRAGAQARRRALEGLVERGGVDVWHAVMASPLSLRLLRPLRTVFTVPIATLDLLNLRGRLAVLAGVALADQVDVLDPLLTERLRTHLAWKSSAIHNTPGSQIDLDAYRPLPYAQKENLLVFCGLLSRAKNAHRLLEVLPAVHAELERTGVRGLSYAFLGRDTEELRFYERVRAVQERLPVKAWFEPNPARVLERAKVFFSVQPLTNYPSKSLLEAIACGALPVVTDVGDSRKIARPDFAFFVRGDFGADDLVAPCKQILGMNGQDFSDRVERGRDFIAQHFSLEASARYYSSLYANAARVGGALEGGQMP